MRSTLLALSLCLCLLPVAAQPPITPNPGAERLILVVPLTGAGNAEDARRPWLLPNRGLPPGILSYSWLPSDDGSLAIVQLTARDRSAFSTFTAAIAAGGRPGLLLFEPHRHSRAEVEAAIKGVKRNFSLDLFRGVSR